MALWAGKVSRAFEKQAPGRLIGVKTIEKPP